MNESVPQGAPAAFILFVAGASPNSRAATANLQRALAKAGLRAGNVDVVDVYERPDLAAAARVLVTPALLRRSDPQMRILGDLSDPGQLVDFLATP
jgi:circadian clock protein KaiB